MTGGPLGLRTGSYGSLQQQNGFSNYQSTPVLVRKSSKLLLSSSREKEKLRPLLCRFFGRRKVAMLLLVFLALLVFVFGSFTVNKENVNLSITHHIENFIAVGEETSFNSRTFPGMKKNSSRSDTSSDLFLRHHQRHFHPKLSTIRVPGKTHPSFHHCEKFAFPPPPPANPKRIGPRPCPVCYLPVEQAVDMMPSFPSEIQP